MKILISNQNNQPILAKGENDEKKLWRNCNGNT